MTFDFVAARQNMLDSQVRVNDVTDLSIHLAMGRIARESVCPADKPWLAYADNEIEYAPGRWLLRPRNAAKLLQAARPVSGECALAIVAPYLALVMEDIGLTVERLDEGDLKTAPAGPYDLIVCEAGIGEVPVSWPAALAVGGRMAVVVRNGPIGKVRLYRRAERETGYREVFDATPPMLAELRPEVGFAF